MNRAVTTLHRQVLTPSSARERAVYTVASIGPEGAAIKFPRQRDAGTLLLPTSHHAAMLEALARRIRLELTEQEQRSLPGEVHRC